MVTLQDVNFAESSLMELLELKGYGDLLVALKIAEENITRRIEATNGVWTKRKLNEIRKQINIEISKAYGGLFDSVAEESVKVAEVTASAVAGVASFKLPKSTVEEILNPNRLIQGYRFEELFIKTEKDHAKALSKEFNRLAKLRVTIASGVSQGLTPNQIVSQYKIKNEKLSRGQVVSNIRTNVADARLIGRHKAYEQLEATGAIRGYEYSATLDGGTTQYCRDHDNRKYYKPIRQIQHLINTHFNERSVFTPISYKKDENEEIGTRASIFGQVKKESYESWYLKQTKSFQRLTLTNRRYNDFLKGKYKVSSLADINKILDLRQVNAGLQGYIK